jgi:hypothetical protein
MDKEVLKLASKRIGIYLLITLLALIFECGYFFGLRTILIYFGVDDTNASLISVISFGGLCLFLGFCAYQIDRAKKDLNR